MKTACPLWGESRVRRLAILGKNYQDWYSRARYELLTICDKEGWNCTDFTSKLAILSPRVSVVRNIRAALAYVGQDGLYLRGIMQPFQTAIAKYETTGKIGGIKVPYFCKALLGDDSAVTLDTWMSRALLKTDNPSMDLFRRKATWEASKQLVCKVATQLSVTPRDCQAMVWCGVFTDHGKQPAYFPILQEYNRWLAYDRKFPVSGTVDLFDSVEPEPDTIETHDSFMAS